MLHTLLVVASTIFAAAVVEAQVNCFPVAMPEIPVPDLGCGWCKDMAVNAHPRVSAVNNALNLPGNYNFGRRSYSHCRAQQYSAGTCCLWGGACAALDFFVGAQSVGVVPVSFFLPPFYKPLCSGEGTLKCCHKIGTYSCWSAFNWPSPINCEGNGGYGPTDTAGICGTIPEAIWHSCVCPYQQCHDPSKRRRRVVNDRGEVEEYDDFDYSRYTPVGTNWADFLVPSGFGVTEENMALAAESGLEAVVDKYSDLLADESALAASPAGVEARRWSEQFAQGTDPAEIEERLASVRRQTALPARYNPIYTNPNDTAHWEGYQTKAVVDRLIRLFESAYQGAGEAWGYSPFDPDGDGIDGVSSGLNQGLDANTWTPPPEGTPHLPVRNTAMLDFATYRGCANMAAMRLVSAPFNGVYNASLAESTEHDTPSATFGNLEPQVIMSYAKISGYARVATSVPNFMDRYAFYYGNKLNETNYDNLRSLLGPVDSDEILKSYMGELGFAVYNATADNSWVLAVPAYDEVPEDATLYDKGPLYEGCVESQPSSLRLRTSDSSSGFELTVEVYDREFLDYGTLSTNALTIDWGDSSIDSLLHDLTTGGKVSDGTSKATYSHVYPAAGTYLVRVWMHNAAERISFSSVLVDVVNGVGAAATFMPLVESLRTEMVVQGEQTGSSGVVTWTVSSSSDPVTIPTDPTSYDASTIDASFHGLAEHSIQGPEGGSDGRVFRDLGAMETLVFGERTVRTLRLEARTYSYYVWNRAHLLLGSIYVYPSFSEGFDQTPIELTLENSGIEYMTLVEFDWTTYDVLAITPLALSEEPDYAERYVYPVSRHGGVVNDPPALLYIGLSNYAVTASLPPSPPQLPSPAEWSEMRAREYGPMAPWHGQKIQNDPQDVVVEFVQERARVTWSPPSTDGFFGDRFVAWYKVEYKMPGGEWTRLGHVTSRGPLHYLSPALFPNEDAEFRVIACNQEGCSPAARTVVASLALMLVGVALACLA